MLKYKPGQYAIIEKNGRKDIQLIVALDSSSERYWILNEPESTIWGGGGYKINQMDSDFTTQNLLFARYKSSSFLWVQEEWVTGVLTKKDCAGCKIFRARQNNRLIRGRYYQSID